MTPIKLVGIFGFIIQKFTDWIDSVAQTHRPTESYWEQDRSENPYSTRHNLNHRGK
jgi:hypothetical protein